MLACVQASLRVCVSVRPSEFVGTVISTIVDGFQNNLTQLFSITCRHAISNIHLGRSKVKVTWAWQVGLGLTCSL